MKVRAFYSSYFSVLPARINFLISKKKKKKPTKNHNDSISIWGNFSLKGMHLGTPEFSPPTKPEAGMEPLLRPL